jgi:mono/diheme cytochrome c family protein
MAGTESSGVDGCRRHAVLRRLVAALAIGVLGLGVFGLGVLGFGSAADAQSEDLVKAGLTTWRSSGCSDCHGAFANGERERDESPTGANIRTSRLDAAALKQTIGCGRPGTGMPAFDEGAYKVRACNGQPLGAPPSDLYPAPRTLTPDEIDAVVAYLQARIIGRGRTITKQECLRYYDDKPDWCESEDYK